MTLVNVNHDKLAAETSVSNVLASERYEQLKSIDTTGKKFASRFAPANQDQVKWLNDWRDRVHPALEGLTPNEAIANGFGDMVVHIIRLNLSPLKRHSEV